MQSNTNCVKATTLTLGSLCAAASVQAEIIHISDSGYTVPFTPTQPSFSWNIDQTGPVEWHWYNTNTPIASIFGYVKNNAMSVLKQSAGNVNLLNLATGYIISGGRNFATYANPIINGNFSLQNGFSSGVEGIFGFKFNPGGTVLYGWAKVTMIPATNTLTVSEWAYEDTGASIPAGVVPEPATTAAGLGVLALGVVGLRHLRTRKAKAK